MCHVYFPNLSRYPNVTKHFSIRLSKLPVMVNTPGYPVMIMPTADWLLFPEVTRARKNEENSPFFVPGKTRKTLLFCQQAMHQ